jgi:hypothetical protein
VRHSPANPGNRRQRRALPFHSVGRHAAKSRVKPGRTRQQWARNQKPARLPLLGLRGKLSPR